ncbi:MAG: glycosyltransferase family 4 protein [Anaerolineae bacterium]|nr:glycosyltransferase family 4 protein [Anaerolineae bacterium]
MTRVLLFGIEPLPDDGTNTHLAAAGLRTWHLLTAIRAAGHDVTLLTNRTFGAYSENLPAIVERRDRGFVHLSIDDTRWHDPRRMRELVTAIGVDGAVATTLTAGSAATNTVSDLPLWVDLYGDPMAEAQLKAALYRDDDQLIHYWQQLIRVLRRGDVFSAVSQPQQCSTVGALGTTGRLNQCSVGYTFVHCIPAASDSSPFPVAAKVIRGQIVPPDAFVILHSGGFNTWTDVDCLFEAVSRLMEKQPQVYLIATGGTITGHDDHTYRRFERLIEGSPFRDRFVLQGWIITTDLPAYYSASDVAVCADRRGYEPQLGSRTRVLDWLRAELPCILSTQPELAQDLAQKGGAMIYSPEDADALLDHLCWCVEHPVELRQIGKRGQEVLSDCYSYHATAQPLLTWLQKPSHAPDYGSSVILFRPAQTLGRQLRRSIQERRLSLALGMQLWSKIAPLTPPMIQRFLVRIGFRALRLKQR